MDVRLPDGRVIANVPEGTTRSEIMARLEKAQIPVNQPEAPEVGIGRTMLDQGLQGATFGFADEISDRIGAGIASVATGESYDSLLKEARQSTKERMAAEFEQNPVTTVASNIAGGLLTGGAASTTKAGAAVTNSFRAGNLPARVAKGVVSGAATGAAYGAGTADEGSRLEGAKQGAILGGVVGGATPVVAATAKGLKSAVAPQIDKATGELAKRAKDLGISLRLDQVSPTRARKTVQKISQDLPFSGADTFEASQRQQWNTAVAKTIGQKDLSPESIKAFLDDASEKFGSVLKDKIIKTDIKALDKAQEIVNSARENITKEYSDIVTGKAERLVNQLFTARQVKSGIEYTPKNLNGEKLASIRSKLVKELPSVAGGARGLVADLVDVIDDIAQKNLVAEDIKKLGIARREWRNFKTLEPLLEKATEGSVNPTSLLERVAASKYIKASRLKVGEDDLVDLARIGKQFMPKAGGSDTQTKLLYAGGGGLGAAALTNPAMAVQGLAVTGGTLAANRGLQKLNANQNLIGLAIKNAGKVPKQISRPAATIGLEGLAATAPNRK